jgi:hypothetical protein
VQIPLKLLRLVTSHFEGNIAKAKMWFVIPNPILSGMRPIDYKINGKWDRLEKMIHDALKEEEDDE